MHLFFIIIGPFYSIYLGMKLENDKTDQIAAKIGETKGKISNRTKFYAAKERIPFLKLKECYKRLNTDTNKVTFNDYIMGVISLSFDKWYKAHGIKGADRILSYVTVNPKRISNNINEVNLENQTIGKYSFYFS